MRPIYLFVAGVFMNFTSLVAQEHQRFDDFWQLLFENKREEALKKFEKKKGKDLESYLIKQLIRNELGQFETPEDFIDDISSKEDFEYYMYALWNHNFFFDSYTTSGFNKKNTDNIRRVEIGKITDPTVKEAMRYLKSAVAQHQNDWEAFYRLNGEIPSIKKWQFCGSFENLNGSGLDTAFEPESYAISKTDFNANSNGHVNWYTPKNRGREAYQYYSNHSEYGGAVNYAQTFITSAETQRVVIRFGSSSLAKVWLNDVLVAENTVDGNTDLDAYNVEVTLPKGNNRLLFKSADQSGIPYFIVRLTELNGAPLQSVSYSAEYVDYNRSTEAELSIKPIHHNVEKFFEAKVKAEPDNFFNTFCLVNSYLRNSKYSEAKSVLLPLLEQYPQSSFLRKYLIETYTKEKDFTTSKEVKENIENDDEDYYLSYIYRFKDAGELFKLPVDEFESFMNNFSEATDMSLLKNSAKLMIALRNEDQELIKKSLDLIMAENIDQLNLMQTYLRIYSGYLNDEDKAIEILERINDDYFDYNALKSLATFYDQRGQKEKALALFSNRYEKVESDNIFLSDYINYLHQYKKYKESLPVIDQMLQNFPYSFVAMELKATALEQLGNKKEALAWYEKSLKHNGAHSSMRKKIEDLSKAPNYFEELATQNIYDFIADNRNKELKNNYGYNYLLDESLLQLFPEGGGKSQVRYVVEITSDSGIESLKEINLGLSGNYSITKSEIVKPNKKIVPASKSGSNLVFNNLEIGDVLYVDYESSYANTGRFYKDHVDYFQFGSYHPIVKNSLKVLVPKGKHFKFETINGEIPYEKKDMNDYTYHKWERYNQTVMPQPENYMPSLSDIATYLHLSTIHSWDDIATWYADLVRPQMVVNSDVETAFKTIFPGGAAGLSEDERASKIYYYLMENFSYSYVGFRQSGYVPQKPSKTIKSKLGDCKDFSTLYVTLAQIANLKAHLVLVLTSDYGKKSMVLPSQDFNHCIAKVFIDGKPQYLELTDNNLPYKSVPTSLEEATALDIPNKWYSQVSSGVYSLSNMAHVPTVIESNMVYSLGEGSHELQIESVLKGSINSHYASIFKEKNYEVVKKDISDDLQSRMEEDFVLDTIRNINYDLRSPVIKYTTNLTVNEKFNELGSMKVFSLPAVNNAYNTNIIEDDERNYPIDYLLYENADIYKSNYRILLSDNEQFVEVPENRELSFKGHQFQMEFKLSKPHELQIDILAHTSKERISAEDYKDFKAYVKAVLDAKKQLIGFKTKAKDGRVNFSGKR